MSKTLIDSVSPAWCHAVCRRVLLWPSSGQIGLDITGRGGVKDGGLVLEVEGCCSTDSFDDIFHDSMIWFWRCKRDDLSTVIADKRQMMRQPISFREEFHRVDFQMSRWSWNPRNMVLIRQVSWEKLNMRCRSVCFVEHFERFEEVGCDEGSYIWELSVFDASEFGGRVDGGHECGGAVSV